MTTDELVDLQMCNWDDLIDLLRFGLPKMGKYGSTGAGDTPAIVKVLRDPEELSRIAAALFKIDCAYEAAVAPLRQNIDKASKDRADARRALIETIIVR